LKQNVRSFFALCFVLRNRFVAKGFLWTIEHHHATTLGVLEELGASDRTILTVFNKVDAATPAMKRRARQLVHDCLFVSAHTKEGLDELEECCIEQIASALGESELLVPHARYDVIAKLHQLGHIREQEHEDKGVRLKASFPPSQAGFFAPFVVKSK
jgi:GTP-binding protein HflX